MTLEHSNLFQTGLVFNSAFMLAKCENLEKNVNWFENPVCHERHNY